MRDSLVRPFVGLFRMSFCDSLLWNHLFQAATRAAKGEGVRLGPEVEREAATGLLADDGLGETWKSVPLSASWSFWKDLTKPHNKVRHFSPSIPLIVVGWRQRGRSKGLAPFRSLSLAVFRRGSNCCVVALPLVSLAFSLGGYENSGFCEASSGDGSL